MLIALCRGRSWGEGRRNDQHQLLLRIGTLLLACFITVLRARWNMRTSRKAGRNMGPNHSLLQGGVPHLGASLILLISVKRRHPFGETNIPVHV